MAEQTSTDDALVASAAAGDRRALEQLLALHADTVYAVCRRVLSDHDAALDASQEALISIARNLGRFDGRSRFSTWIYRIATNAAIDEGRRISRRPTPIEELPEQGAPGSDVDDRVAASLDVEAALTDVPAEFRTALVLRDCHDLDYAEIAEILEVPVGTVRSRISRGRTALTAALDRASHGGSADLSGNEGPLPDRPRK